MHTAEARAISATLGALASRLSPEVALRVRSSLPPAMAAELRGPKFGGAFDAAEFYAHVGELERVDPVTAATHARDACHVIAQNLPPDVVVAMQRDLGPELGPLLHDDHGAERPLHAAPREATPASSLQKNAAFLGVMVAIAIAAAALVAGLVVMFLGS